MVREENKPRTGPPDKKMLFAKSLREIEALRFRQRRRLMNVSFPIVSFSISCVGAHVLLCRSIPCECTSVHVQVLVLSYFVRVGDLSHMVLCWRYCTVNNMN